MGICQLLLLIVERVRSQKALEVITPWMPRPFSGLGGSLHPVDLTHEFSNRKNILITGTPAALICSVKLISRNACDGIDQGENNEVFKSDPKELPGWPSRSVDGPCDRLCSIQ